MIVITIGARALVPGRDPGRGGPEGGLLYVPVVSDEIDTVEKIFVRTELFNHRSPNKCDNIDRTIMTVTINVYIYIYIYTYY